jgi:hypothetical protein
MKKLFLLIILIFIPLLSYCQENSMILGINGGVLLPMQDFSNNFNISPKVGLEGVYGLNYDVSLFVDLGYNFLTQKVSNPNLSYYFTESTVGVRYNFNSDDQKIFGELGGGAYVYGSHYSDNTGYTSSYSKLYFGFNLGFGTYIPLSKKLAFTGKVKYHDVFSNSDFSPTNSYTNFLSAAVGLSYIFR